MKDGWEIIHRQPGKTTERMQVQGGFLWKVSEWTDGGNIAVAVTFVPLIDRYADPHK